MSSLINPGPPPFLHLDRPEMIAALRSILGEKLSEAAERSQEGLQGTSDSFRRERAMTNAVLRRVAEGREIVAAEVEAEAGESILRSELGRRAHKTDNLESLERQLVDFLAWAGSRARHLDGSINYHQAWSIGKLQEFASRAGAAIVERAELGRKAAQAEETLGNLRPIAATLAAAAVEGAGGVDRVALMVKESLMARSQWPGPDFGLDRLEEEVMAAAKKRDRFRSEDPEAPEGPLALAARAELEPLVVARDERRIEVEREAVDRIGLMVHRACAGHAEAIGSVLGHVRAVPEAFPAAFGPALAEIPLAAAIQAGPAAFAHCL